MSKAKTEKATFALECTWHIQDYFTNLNGVRSVTVVKLAKDRDNPTDRDIGNDSEAVDVEFDPSVISYRELLDHFWTQHNPTKLQNGRYAAVIFTHGKDQYDEAEHSKDERQARMRRNITTQVMPVEAFYPGGGSRKKTLHERRPLHYKTSCRH